MCCATWSSTTGGWSLRVKFLEALWPETYVNPELIKKYILGIRKVLGDQHDKPVFIETFPKRGYQFVAPVRDDTAAELAEVPSATERKMVGRKAALAELQRSLDKALTGPAAGHLCHR